MPPATPEAFKALILAKHPDGVAADGRRYADIPALELTQKIVNKYPDGQTNDGRKYKDFLNAAPVAPEQNILQKIAGGAKSVFNALTSSEQGLGSNIASAITANSQVNDATHAAQLDQQYIDTLLSLKKKAQDAGKDTSHWDTLIANYQPQRYQMPDLPTTGQVLGNAAGTALDIASFGSYGAAAKGAKTASLLIKGGGTVEKVATKLGIPTTQRVAAEAATTGKLPLGQTLKTIGKQTVARSAVGGATGYGYDVATNLQQGKTGAEAFTPGFGTYAGLSVPALIGGVRAGVAITKDTAPRFINSLIKPSKANFAYGKDPGRTVSEMGITGNSLPDFEKNISAAKQDIGSKIGAVYSNPANAGVVIDATPELAKIDEAITTAAKGGKSNQAIVTALQNAKDALLYEHTVNADGVIEKVGTVPRDLTKLSPQEAFHLKDLVAQATRFTGNPSDDKTVNTTLQRVYGGIKDTLNAAVGKNNPEITDLNQKYADLTSAELAVRNRDAISSRANMINLPGKEILGGTGIASLLTGNPVPVLVGISAVALEKALASTAVKTRIAAWLGSAQPSVVAKVLQQNPGIRTVLYRALPKYASQLGQTSQ